MRNSCYSASLGSYRRPTSFLRARRSLPNVVVFHPYVSSRSFFFCVLSLKRSIETCDFQLSAYPPPPRACARQQGVFQLDAFVCTIQAETSCCVSPREKIVFRPSVQGHLQAALALLEGGATPGGQGVVVPHNGSGTAAASSSSDESDISDISDSDVSEYSGEWEGDLTPLHLACAGGHTEIVRALLSAGERTDRLASGRKVCGLDLGGGNGSDPPVADHFGGIGVGSVAPFFGGGGERDGGHTPMHLASACGAAGAVRALVEAGASVHRRAGDCDDTPLHLASAAGQVEVVAALLEAGADIDAEDEIGNTSLHVARDARTLEFLLARGANPNLVAMSHYGSGSPLGSYCTLIHRLETDEEGMASATAQVQRGAFFCPFVLRRVFPAGRTVRLHAPPWLRSAAVHMERFLVATRACHRFVPPPPYSRFVPPALVMLHALCDCSSVEQPMHKTFGGLSAPARVKVETLLRYGADVNITASTSSHDDELPTHLQQGAATATSPILSCAAKNGIPGIVSALLRAGLDPDQRDRDGWAPLHDGMQCCFGFRCHRTPQGKCFG